MNKLVGLIKIYFKSLSARNCTFAVALVEEDKVYIFKNGRYVVATLDHFVNKIKVSDKKTIAFLEIVLKQINLILEND